MTEFISQHWLDIFTTILGIIYLVLEYRASIALWIVGIIMPALDIYLYWTHGLYGDAGMAVYYTLAAVYGYAVWQFGKKQGQTTIACNTYAQVAISACIRILCCGMGRHLLCA